VEPVKIIARSESERGEVVLRRRHMATGDVDELIINGAFAMDSAETRSERELGRLASGSRHVLLGGLGLGYTAAEMLSGAVVRLDVVELEGSLVEWAQAGGTDVLRQVAADPRVHLYVGDVAEVLAPAEFVEGTGAELVQATGAEHVEAPRGPSTSSGPRIRTAGPVAPRGPWDAILLDVDNGPDFLIHSQNASVYTPPVLAAAYRNLTAGGLLGVWCQGEAPALESVLRELGGAVEVHTMEILRGERQLGYLIYVVRRSASGGQVP
jgi:hypothetical protein